MKKIERPSWSKNILLCLLGMMVGGMLFGILIFSGATTAFVTDGRCNDMIMNESSLAFIYGRELQLVYLMNESVNCRQIPIKYDDYERTLIALECLQAAQNG